jgi:predicted transcriptional regulator
MNGRRVRVADLMDAGLLKPGQELFYEQRIGSTPHEAVVTERGRLKLTDGSEFTTPSAAGAAVADVRAVPGWTVWRVGANGPTLHELRLQLLKSVAEEMTSDRGLPVEEAEAVRRRFAVLEDARKCAEAGEPRTRTVREFIKLWGLEDRDRAASAQIDADLANHGLITVPDFRTVTLDRAIRMELVPERREHVRTESDAGGSPIVAPVEVNDEQNVDIGLTLGNLLSNDTPLLSVSRSATIEEAITVMLINDYSQVAVLANPYTLHGAVSWESVAAAKHRSPNATLNDAIDLRARDRVYDYDRRLLDVLHILKQDEFIFVRDDERKIAGIITAADVVHKYDETATPFFLIGEIDQYLRQLIQNTFDEEAVRVACEAAKQSFGSFGNMSMGQYQAVLDNPECWRQLGWRLERKPFIARLNEIRKLRNNVMHFNPDPVKPSDVEKLRIFRNLVADIAAESTAG